jgi:RNA polymerase sigma-70 factor (ECF subfamily)
LSRTKPDFPGFHKKYLRSAGKTADRCDPILREGMAAGDNSSSHIETVRQSSSQAAGVQERVIALYEAHRDGIYRFLVGHGLETAAAQEVVQDVFVDLFMALEKGTRVNSEQGWLYAVAGRAAVDYWRRERRPIRLELDFNTGPVANLPSAAPSPEAQAGNRERLRRLAAGLARLPKEQRFCIQLRMQGLRYREIARILGVSTSTAAEWLVSAVSRLREDAQ